MNFFERIRRIGETERERREREQRELFQKASEGELGQEALVLTQIVNMLNKEKERIRRMEWMKLPSVNRRMRINTGTGQFVDGYTRLEWWESVTWDERMPFRHHRIRVDVESRLESAHPLISVAGIRIDRIGRGHSEREPIKIPVFKKGALEEVIADVRQRLDELIDFPYRKPTERANYWARREWRPLQEKGKDLKFPLS